MVTRPYAPIIVSAYYTQEGCWPFSRRQIVKEAKIKLPFLIYRYKGNDRQEFERICKEIINARASAIKGLRTSIPPDIHVFMDQHNLRPILFSDGPR